MARESFYVRKGCDNKSHTEAQVREATNGALVEQTPTALLELLQLLTAQLPNGRHHCLEGSLQTLPQDHVIRFCP